MAYKIDRTGENVEDLLDSVDDKTIYPDASITERGLMTKEDKIKLKSLEDDEEMSLEEIASILDF